MFSQAPVILSTGGGVRLWFVRHNLTRVLSQDSHIIHLSHFITYLCRIWFLKGTQQTYYLTKQASFPYFELELVKLDNKKLLD